MLCIEQIYFPWIVFVEVFETDIYHTPGEVAMAKNQKFTGIHSHELTTKQFKGTEYTIKIMKLDIPTYEITG